MPSEKKGYVYSLVRDREDFLVWLESLFPEGFFLFVENPQNPAEFGSSELPDSIEFPGFIFDSKKEVRWHINDGRFLITVISDECMSGLSEVGGIWTREGLDEYIKELFEYTEANREGDEVGIFLVDPRLPQINIRSKDLCEYLKKERILRNAELFSRSAIPIFLTLRGGKNDI